MRVIAINLIDSLDRMHNTYPYYDEPLQICTMEYQIFKVILAFDECLQI